MVKALILAVMLSFTGISCVSGAVTPPMVELPPVTTTGKIDCNTIGKYQSKKVTLLVVDKCKNFPGTMVIFLLKEKPFLAGIDEGTKAMVKILGYKPKLMPLFNSTVPLKNYKKKYPVNIFLVTGRADE